jgi:hypothetical protein
MKRLLVLLMAGFMVIGFAMSASASVDPMQFKLDFGQDGSFEDTWILDPSEVVWIDVYVSNIPPPGLISMGFDIEYDPRQLAVTPGTAVDAANWYINPQVNIDTPGEIEMKGGRVFPGLYDPLSGLAGNDIKLGTIELHCILPGISDLWLFDSDRQGGYDDFVLQDGTVLDVQLKDGVKVGTIINTPIPSAVLLLGSGLVGLLGFRRRMRD